MRTAIRVLIALNTALAGFALAAAVTGLADLTVDSAAEDVVHDCVEALAPPGRPPAGAEIDRLQARGRERMRPVVRSVRAGWWAAFAAGAANAAFLTILARRRPAAEQPSPPAPA